MAFGPVPPHSIITAGNAGRAGGDVYDGTTTTGNRYQAGGFYIAASIAADTNVGLFFNAPWSALPAGTPQLVLWMRTSATTGNARVNIKWAMAGQNDDPAAQTLVAEGVQTFTANGTAHRLSRLITVLDATTFVANGFLNMKLTFETASWTLAAKSFWLAQLVIS